MRNDINSPKVTSIFTQFTSVKLQNEVLLILHPKTVLAKWGLKQLETTENVTYNSPTIFNSQNSRRNQKN